MISLTQIQTALAIEDFDVANAHRQMAPHRPNRQALHEQAINPRLGAVMLLLFPHHDELSFVLIKRVEYPGVHSGQISFPGGRHENGETFLQTAVRETHEEVGVAPEAMQILGKLSPIYIPPSNFEVHPFVAYIPEKPRWTPDLNEVAQVIEMPIISLLDDNIKRQEEWHFPDNVTRPIRFYAYGIHKIWGATAVILSEFEARLKQVMYNTHMNQAVPGHVNGHQDSYTDGQA